MKVKCIKNNKNIGLTINKNYIVYAGEFVLNNGIKNYIFFKIEYDNGSVIPYEASNFIIISYNYENYIEREINDKNRYEFNYKSIAYWEFWSMFYDEVGNSIQDFLIAKRELCIKEFCYDDILSILNSDNLDEKEFIIEILTLEKNDTFIKYIIKICKEKLDKYNKINELIFLFTYLKEFKSNEEINNFFIEYLSENEKGNNLLDNIVYRYFEE